MRIHWFFHDGDPYHLENSPLICSAIQWSGYCMTKTSTTKKLNVIKPQNLSIKSYLIHIKCFNYDLPKNDFIQKPSHNITLVHHQILLLMLMKTQGSSPNSASNTK